MARQIRPSMFETNSSSAHALIVIGNDNYEKRLDSFKIANNKIIATPGGFGWNNPTLVTPNEKLAYVLTVITRIFNDEEVATEEELSGTKFTLLSEAIKDYTGYELAYKPLNDKYHPNGYIDHQSDDLLDEYFYGVSNEKFKDNMKELIFNNKYSIDIDNDNH